MKITGKIEVEGVILNISIEAPDDAEELYVTNISRDHIAIPKDQMLIDHLGLNEGTVRHLEKLNIHNLGQLLARGWEIKALDGLPEPAKWDIERAVQELRRGAVIFEPVDVQEIAPETTDESAKPKELSIREAGEISRKVLFDPSCRLEPVTMESPFSRFGFPPQVTKAIQRKHGNINVKELIALGRTKLIMTPGLNSHDVDLIEVRVEAFGYKLGFPDMPLADMSDTPSEEVLDQDINDDGEEKSDQDIDDDEVEDEFQNDKE